MGTHEQLPRLVAGGQRPCARTAAACALQPSCQVAPSLWTDGWSGKAAKPRARGAAGVHCLLRGWLPKGGPKVIPKVAPLREQTLRQPHETFIACAWGVNADRQGIIRKRMFQRRRIFTRKFLRRDAPRMPATKSATSASARHASPNHLATSAAPSEAPSPKRAPFPKSWPTTARLRTDATGSRHFSKQFRTRKANLREMTVVVGTPP